MTKPVKKKFTKAAAAPTSKALGKKLHDEIYKLIEGSAGDGGKRALKLIAQGADVNARDESGDSALYMAAGFDGPEFVEIVKELVARGADVDAKNSFKETALGRAARAGCDATVDILLRANAALDVQASDSGATALISAVGNDYDGIAAALIAKGAALDLQDKEGDTALLLAALSPFPGSSSEKCAELLLAAGADPCKKNKAGKTARDHVAEYDNDSLLRLIDAKISERKEAAAMKKIEDDINGGLKHDLPPITPLDFKAGKKCPSP